MNRTGREAHPTDTSALEGRMAARLAGGLSFGAQNLPHDVVERLRVAREQAVQRAGLARQAASGGSQLAGVTSSGAALLGGLASWRLRLAAALPLLLMIAGLVAIDRYTTYEQVLAAADIDTQLLSDSLPPAAYSDPGFAEYLRSAPVQ